MDIGAGVDGELGSLGEMVFVSVGLEVRADEVVIFA